MSKRFAPSRWRRYAPGRVGRDVRAYLRGFDEHSVGVLFRRARRPWARTYVWGALGLSLSLLAVYLILPAQLAKHGAKHHLLFVGAGTIGLTMLLAAVHTAVLRGQPTFLGEFLLIDPRYVWFAGPHGVQAYELADLQQSRLTHHYLNGSYTESSLALAFPGEEGEVRIERLDHAEAAHTYLGTLAFVLAQLAPAERSDTRLVGGVVADVLQHGAWPTEAVEPGPEVPELGGTAARFPWSPRLVQGLATLGATLVLCLAVFEAVRP